MPAPRAPRDRRRLAGTPLTVQLLLLSTVAVVFLVPAVVMAAAAAPMGTLPAGAPGVVPARVLAASSGVGATAVATPVPGAVAGIAAGAAPTRVLAAGSGVGATAVAASLPGSAAGIAAEAASAGGLAAGAASPEPANGRARLERFVAGLETLQADFVQEVVNRDGELVEASAGTVLLAKPGRFRWNYMTPFERTIVADGERVWLYEADLDQVTVRRLDEALGETPAALLTGAVDSLDRFEVLDARRDQGLDWVRLAPRSPVADFETVSLGFEGERLARLELRDRLGQLTRLAFDAAVRNAPLAEDAFRFEVPPGADVIGTDEL